MATRRQKPQPGVPPRLYLRTPALADVAAFQPPLREALAASDVSAVLLRLAAADERSLVNRAKTLAAPVQERGVALIVDSYPEIVARAGADGAHLSGIKAFTAAVASLKPDRIAGCGGLASKHDAMLAGERGADYVMFGEPDEIGLRPSFKAVCDRVAWWAELFEIPCVGYASNLEEIGALATAGADFVGLDSFVWKHERGPAEAVKAAASRLAWA